MPNYLEQITSLEDLKKLASVNPQEIWNKPWDDETKIDIVAQIYTAQALLREATSNKAYYGSINHLPDTQAPYVPKLKQYYNTYSREIKERLGLIKEPQQKPKEVTVYGWQIKGKENPAIATYDVNKTPEEVANELMGTQAQDVSGKISQPAIQEEIIKSIPALGKKPEDLIADIEKYATEFKPERKKEYIEDWEKFKIPTDITKQRYEGFILNLLDNFIPFDNRYRKRLLALEKVNPNLKNDPYYRIEKGLGFTVGTIGQLIGLMTGVSEASAVAPSKLVGKVLTPTKAIQLFKDPDVARIITNALGNATNMVAIGKFSRISELVKNWHRLSEEQKRQAIEKEILPNTLLDATFGAVNSLLSEVPATKIVREISKTVKTGTREATFKVPQVIETRIPHYLGSFVAGYTYAKGLGSDTQNAIKFGLFNLGLTYMNDLTHKTKTRDLVKEQAIKTLREINKNLTREEASRIIDKKMYKLGEEIFKSYKAWRGKATQANIYGVGKFGESYLKGFKDFINDPEVQAWLYRNIVSEYAGLKKGYVPKDVFVKEALRELSQSVNRVVENQAPRIETQGISEQTVRTQTAETKTPMAQKSPIFDIHQTATKNIHFDPESYIPLIVELKEILDPQEKKLVEKYAPKLESENPDEREEAKRILRAVAKSYSVPIRIGDKKAFYMGGKDLFMNLLRHPEYVKGKTLVFIDLDGLKQVNDTYGHLAGDTYLQILAKAIKKIPKSIIDARWGGDELALLLDAPEEEAKKYLKMIDLHIPLEDRSIPGGFTAVVGKLETDNPEEEFKKLDEWEKEAKKTKKKMLKAEDREIMPTVIFTKEDLTKRDISDIIRQELNLEVKNEEFKDLGSEERGGRTPEVEGLPAEESPRGENGGAYGLGQRDTGNIPRHEERGRSVKGGKKGRVKTKTITIPFPNDALIRGKFIQENQDLLPKRPKYDARKRRLTLHVLEGHEEEIKQKAQKAVEEWKKKRAEARAQKKAEVKTEVKQAGSQETKEEIKEPWKLTSKEWKEKYGFSKISKAKARQINKLEYQGLLWKVPLNDYLGYYFKDAGKELVFSDLGSVGRHILPTPQNIESAKEFHKGVVERALKEGKPVPPKVLKDYPDLAEKYLKAKPTETEGKAEAELPFDYPQAEISHLLDGFAIHELTLYTKSPQGDDRFITIKIDGEDADNAVDILSRYFKKNDVSVYDKGKDFIIVSKDEIKKAWGEVDKAFKLNRYDIRRISQYYDGHKEVIEKMRKNRVGAVYTGNIAEGTKSLAQSFGVFLSDVGRSTIANIMRQLGLQGEIEEAELRKVLDDVPAGLHKYIDYKGKTYSEVLSELKRAGYPKQFGRNNITPEQKRIISKALNSKRYNTDNVREWIKEFTGGEWEDVKDNLTREQAQTIIAAIENAQELSDGLRYITANPLLVNYLVSQNWDNKNFKKTHNIFHSAPFYWGPLMQVAIEEGVREQYLAELFEDEKYKQLRSEWSKLGHTSRKEQIQIWRKYFKATWDSQNKRFKIEPRVDLTKIKAELPHDVLIPLVLSGIIPQTVLDKGTPLDDVAHNVVKLYRELTEKGKRMLKDMAGLPDAVFQRQDYYHALHDEHTDKAIKNYYPSIYRYYKTHRDNAPLNISLVKHSINAPFFDLNVMNSIRHYFLSTADMIAFQNTPATIFALAKIHDLPRPALENIVDFMFSTIVGRDLGREQLKRLFGEEAGRLTADFLNTLRTAYYDVTLSLNFRPAFKNIFQSLFVPYILGFSTTTKALTRTRDLKEYNELYKFLKNFGGLTERGLLEQPTVRGQLRKVANYMPTYALWKQADKWNRFLTVITALEYAKEHGWSEEDATRLAVQTLAMTQWLYSLSGRAMWQMTGTGSVLHKFTAFAKWINSYIVDHLGYLARKKMYGTILMELFFALLWSMLGIRMGLWTRDAVMPLVGFIKNISRGRLPSWATAVFKFAKDWAGLIYAYEEAARTGNDLRLRVKIEDMNQKYWDIPTVVQWMKLIRAITDNYYMAGSYGDDIPKWHWWVNLLVPTLRIHRFNLQLQDIRAYNKLYNATTKAVRHELYKAGKSKNKDEAKKHLEKAYDLFKAYFGNTHTKKVAEKYGLLIGDVYDKNMNIIEAGIMDRFLSYLNTYYKKNMQRNALDKALSSALGHNVITEAYLMYYRKNKRWQQDEPSPLDNLKEILK